MNETDRCFARDQDELFAFFEHYVGGAKEHVFPIAMGDAAKGAHAARDHNHGIARVGTAGEGSVHALDAVGLDALRDLEAIGQLLG